MSERYTPGQGDDYFESYARALEPLASGFVLDIGCGEGHLSKRVANRPDVLQVIGTDRFDGRVVEHPKFLFVQVPTEDLIRVDCPLRFDTILATEHIEHLEEWLHLRLVAWVRAHLASDGTFLGSMPDQEAPAGPWHKKEYYGWRWESILREFFPDVRLWNVQSSCYVWAAKLAPGPQG